MSVITERSHEATEILVPSQSQASLPHAASFEKSIQSQTKKSDYEKSMKKIEETKQEQSMTVLSNSSAAK